MSKNKIWAISVSAIMLAAVIVGLVFSGSPEQARKMNADNSRVSLLSQINNSIDSYYQDKKSLPVALVDLQKQPTYYLSSVDDPITGYPIEYAVLTATSYQLCATFDLASPSDDRQNEQYYYPYDKIGFWQHPAGRYCYQLETPTAINAKPLPEPVQP